MAESWSELAHRVKGCLELLKVAQNRLSEPKHVNVFVQLYHLGEIYLKQIQIAEHGRMPADMGHKIKLIKAYCELVEVDIHEVSP